jgi:hypothetical protein
MCNWVDEREGTRERKRKRGQGEGARDRCNEIDKREGTRVRRGVRGKVRGTSIIGEVRTSDGMRDGLMDGIGERTMEMR